MAPAMSLTMLAMLVLTARMMILIMVIRLHDDYIADGNNDYDGAADDDCDGRDDGLTMTTTMACVD